MCPLAKVVVSMKPRFWGPGQLHANWEQEGEGGGTQGLGDYCPTRVSCHVHGILQSSQREGVRSQQQEVGYVLHRARSEDEGAARIKGVKEMKVKEMQENWELKIMDMDT